MHECNIFVFWALHHSFKPTELNRWVYIHTRPPRTNGTAATVLPWHALLGTTRTTWTGVPSRTGLPTCSRRRPTSPTTTRWRLPTRATARCSTAPRGGGRPWTGSAGREAGHGPSGLCELHDQYVWALTTNHLPTDKTAREIPCWPL